MAFYRQKQKRRGGVEENFVEAIKISPAEGEIHAYRKYNMFIVIWLLIPDRNRDL